MEFKQARGWGSGYIPLFTCFWYPARFIVTATGIRMVKKSLFGLTGIDKTVRWNAVAAVNTKNGLFTRTVQIETSGGETLTVKAFSKKTARLLMDAIHKHQNASQG